MRFPIRIPRCSWCRGIGCANPWHGIERSVAPTMFGVSRATMEQAGAFYELVKRESESLKKKLDADEQRFILGMFRDGA